MNQTSYHRARNRSPGHILCGCLLLVLSACDQRPVDPGGVTVDGTVTKLITVDAEYIRFLSGASASDVYAVGGRGFYHFDGSEWGEVAELQDPYSVWAAASDDVYASGREPGPWGLYHFDGVTWTVVDEVEAAGIVTGSSANDVFVRSDQAIVHFDGLAWDTVTVRPQAHLSFAMHATGGHLFAALVDSLARFDGASTSVEPGPGGFIRSVWAASPTVVWVLAGCGMWRNEGMGWVEEVPPTVNPCQLSSVWGTSPADVWAVGGYGTVLRYDGTSLAQIDAGTVNSFGSVWAFDAANVFVGGSRGNIIHFDGSTWRKQMDRGPLDFSAVWPIAADDILVSDYGGAFHRYSGGAWTEFPFYVTGGGVSDMAGTAPGCA